MKYKLGNFYQKSRQAYMKLLEARASASTCHLYDVLCFNEHRFTGTSEDFFYRSIKDLGADSSLSPKTIIKGLRALEKIDLIETWQMHWVDNKTNKKSEKHVTAIRILD